MAIAFDMGGLNGTISDANMTDGQYTVTSASNPWTADDVGNVIQIAGALAGPTDMISYIVSVDSSGQVTVANQCTRSVTNVSAWWHRGNYNHGTTTTSLTWKHICSGSNLYLVVALWVNKAVSDISAWTAKFNSVSMTLLDYYRHTSGVHGAALFGLANPASGSLYDVLVETNGAAASFAGTSASYTGVLQSGSTGTPAHTGNATGGTSQSLNVTSATNEMVVDCVAAYYKTSVWTATGTGQTKRASLIPRTTNDFGGTQGQVVSSSTPGATTTTVSYTTDVTEYWSICGIPLKPAADGTTGLMWI